jgi:pyruvate formate lyase activating enzyme
LIPVLTCKKQRCQPARKTNDPAAPPAGCARFNGERKDRKNPVPADPDLTGTIFNIQRFSIHDGPGIRTTVFLKGCNLRCHWCHNPESQRMAPEVEFFPEKCIACGACADTCPQGAQRLESNQRTYLRDLCRVCLSCVQECFSGALLVSGEKRTVSQVLAEIAKDAAYYQSSGGGVTFSGGEPLLQSDFLQAALAACQQQGYHTAVDTAGCVPWERFEALLPYTGLFLYDIKAINDAVHRRFTGVGNQLILENLRRLAVTGKEIWVRVPLVAGVNDTPDEIAAIARLLASLGGISRLEILPYHLLGAEKYTALGMPYPAQGYQAPNLEQLDRILAVFESHGVPVACMK